jgi:hypothetical protein
MTCMRSWKSHRLTSYTWLGLNPQIGRPLSRIVGAIGYYNLYKSFHIFENVFESLKFFKMSNINQKNLDLSGNSLENLEFFKKPHITLKNPQFYLKCLQKAL